MDSIVKVFEQSGISQGIQFFDDPSGRYGFAISAQDLADCLGISEARKMPCKKKYQTTVQIVGPDRVPSNVPVVIEPGVYEAIGRSEASNAEAFQDWLWEEVIPSIRNAGGYGANQSTESLNGIKAKIEAIKSMPGLTLPPGMVGEDPKTLFIAGIQVGIELCKSYLS